MDGRRVRIYLGELRHFIANEFRSFEFILYLMCCLFRGRVIRKESLFKFWKKLRLYGWDRFEEALKALRERLRVLVKVADDVLGKEEGECYLFDRWSLVMREERGGSFIRVDEKDLRKLFLERRLSRVEIKVLLYGIEENLFNRRPIIKNFEYLARLFKEKEYAVEKSFERILEYGFLEEVNTPYGNVYGIKLGKIEEIKLEEERILEEEDLIEKDFGNNGNDFRNSSNNWTYKAFDTKTSKISEVLSQILENLEDKETQEKLQNLSKD